MSATPDDTRTRSPRVAAIALATVAFHTGWLLAPSPTIATVCAYGLVLAAAVAALLREPYALHVALLFAAMAGWWLSHAPLVWPLYFLAPLAAYGFAARSVRPLRRTTTWLRRGRIDRMTTALMGASALVVPLVLAGWLRFAHPSLDAFRDQLPDGVSARALVAIGAVFAFGNALLEESIWRGVLMESLDRGLGRGVASIAVSAVSFGVAHVAGFPRGVFGVLLAAFSGVLLGVIRRRSEGLLAPMITHVLVDTAVFALLVRAM